MYVRAGFQPCLNSSLQKKIKICFRYLKVIFNKKMVTTFIVSLVIFNSYTLFLNNKYEQFYKEVNQEVRLDAIIISSAKENEYYNSYTIKGKTNEFKNKKFTLYVKKDIVLEYGDKVNVIGELSEPEETRNYKGFNHKKYLQTEKIYGTIKAEKAEVKLKNNTLLIFKLSNSLRDKIINQIKIIMPEETSGLLIGLMLGEKNYISDEVRLDFQKSSLSHILAVSGAHVSYIILGLNYLILINKTPKKSGYIFIIFSLIVFIFITNFSVSVVRACIMSILVILSKIFYRKSDILNTISISVLIIVIFNPFSINSVSMQLSYLGTIGVIYVSPIIEKFLIQTVKRSGLILFLQASLGVEIMRRLPEKIKSNNDEIWRAAKNYKDYKYSNSSTNNNITNNDKKLWNNIIYIFNFKYSSNAITWSKYNRRIFAYNIFIYMDMGNQANWYNISFYSKSFNVNCKILWEFKII